MIAATYTGPERVECMGQAYTGPNAEGDCARWLIGEGYDPGERIEFIRNGTPCLRGSVAAFASRAWGGNGRDPQFREWAPHPQGTYAPRLVQWHAERAAKRARARVGRVEAVEASGGRPGAFGEVGR